MWQKLLVACHTFGVELIPLCLQTPQVLALVIDLQLC